MLRRLLTITVAVLTLSVVVEAQNTNSSTTTNKVRPRTTNANTNTAPPQKPAKPVATPATARRAIVETPGSGAVLAAFNKILDGIRHADVDEVTTPYWNSKQLILFNNNGTVTRSWEQMRKNRESSYPDMKDVKLDVRDVHVTMLGRDGALVTCLWNQSLTYKGVPETASGRMTLAFKRLGTDWKAIHLHTSNDRPDPSRISASEGTASPTASPRP